MDTIFDQLLLPVIQETGLQQGQTPLANKRCGLLYRADPAVGNGYIWAYPVRDLFLITIYDVVFYDTIAIEYTHPAFLTLGNYDTEIAELIQHDAGLGQEHLLGYIGEEDVFRQTLRPNIHLNCVSVTLLPEYYKTLLANRFSRDFSCLPEIITQLNGKETIPEAALALKQLRTAQPSEATARIYYESKLMEIIAILLQWGEGRPLYTDGKDTSPWELEMMQKIHGLLRQNYRERLSLANLAKSACMSQTKMTQLFRRVYGISVMDYVQSLRLEKAKDLLLNSDWDIGKIANAVGYKLHRSFSEVFKQTTGFTPREYRKQIR